MALTHTTPVRPLLVTISLKDEVVPRCSRCNRRLTNPVHAKAGIGPTCARKLGLTMAQAQEVRDGRNA